MNTIHFIGRNAQGDRSFVEISVKSTAQVTQTVDHQPVSSGTRISFTGFVIEKGRRTASTAGQCVADIARTTEPAAGWTRDDISTLVTLWNRWHLNDMNAGCVHETNCPEGYSHGSAWLYEAPTDEALRQIERLQSLPTGNVPSDY